MQFIDGKKLSDNLDSLPNNIEICKMIGQNIAKLHDNDIIHGDLTTSNMIYSFYVIKFKNEFLTIGSHQIISLEKLTSSSLLFPKDFKPSSNL